MEWVSLTCLVFARPTRLGEELTGGGGIMAGMLLGVGKSGTVLFTRILADKKITIIIF